MELGLESVWYRIKLGIVYNGIGGKQRPTEISSSTAKQETGSANNTNFKI